MTTLPTLPYPQTITMVNTPLNPLAGGSLGIGPSGLAGLAGQFPGVGPLPFRTPAGATGLFGGSAGVGGLPRLGATGAGQLADVATLRPLASSAAAMPAETALANQIGRAASSGGVRGFFSPAAGMSKLGMAGRIGTGAFLGQLASQGVDALNPGGQNSNIEQGLQGAALGAGIGGSIGSIVPGIGTALGAGVGALGGGAIGVLSNVFGGGGDKEADTDPLTVLSTAITSANLSADATENILTTYETLMALAEQQEGDAKEAARQAAFDQTAALVLSTMQQEQAAQDMATGLGGANTLALQQQAQQIFEPIAQDIESGASLYAQAISGIRDQLPESYRGVVDTQVARELTSADKLANAYRAQAALTPIANQLSQYQQQQDAFARQQYQQMLAQQAAGGGAAAGGSVQDILAQMG